MDALFQIPPGPKELAEAEAHARKLGIPEQTILEARFLFFVENKNDAGIIGLLPTWQKLEPQFTLDHSEIFATREDFLAVIEFAHALKALRDGKRSDFKKHITEALWLSPSQASAFTPYIQSLRLSEHIKDAKISLDAPLRDLVGESSQSLVTILGDQRAILLQFWSPWSPDCETGMNELSTLSTELKDQKIAIASVLIDGRTEILTEARDFLKGLEKPSQGIHLIDRGKDSLASQLRVTDLPTFVLISREGKILSHGRSDSPALRTAIQQLTSPPKKP
jgi:thioredoxin-like negative regulator of GroEL